MSTVASAEEREAPEPVAAPPPEARSRRLQMYVGLAIAAGVTVAWIALLVLLVWRLAGLALSVVL